MANRKYSSLGCGCLILTFVLFAVAFTLVMLIINLKSHKNISAYVDPSEKYIATTKELAQATAQKYGLFASVIMAQSALESNWGTSELSQKYHNYFGIKANPGEDGVNLETLEFVNGKSGQYEQTFRIYKSKEDSFHHYGKLMTQAVRYTAVKNAKTYQEAAKMLKKCGYATDPNYDKKIIQLIETYGFHQWDRTRGLEQGLNGKIK